MSGVRRLSNSGSAFLWAYDHWENFAMNESREYAGSEGPNFDFLPGGIASDKG